MQIRACVEHYQQNLNPVPNVSVQYTDYDMGTLTGTAKWKMTIIADPCNAKEKLVFHGQDQIQRTWKGYQIDSKMNLEQGQGQFSESLSAASKCDNASELVGCIDHEIEHTCYREKRSRT